jgi:hypothetical protein
MDEVNEKSMPQENFIEFNKIQLDERIGEGGQSTVFSGTFEENSETIHQVAIKEIKLKKLNDCITDFTLSM